MTRLTPFEHALASLAEERFGTVREEAARSLKDPADRVQFASLPAVQRILGEVEAPGVVAAAPEAATEYLNLLYVAYRYWAAGRHVVALDGAMLEQALAAPPPRAVPPLPGGACYVQLPERRVWAQIASQAPHEPLDGLFVAAGPGGREVVTVAVLGLRPARDGFSQISAVATPEEFAAAPREARTPPFAPVLEGGDRAGFLSVVNTAELLLLTQLALAREEQ